MSLLDSLKSAVSSAVSTASKIASTAVDAAKSAVSSVVGYVSSFVSPAPSGPAVEVSISPEVRISPPSPAPPSSSSGVGGGAPSVPAAQSPAPGAPAPSGIPEAPSPAPGVAPAAPPELASFIASVNPINGMAAFGDFIAEEAMQTAGMGVYQLVRMEDWAAAGEALDRLVDLWRIAKNYRDSFGRFNVATGYIFEANLQAVASQILAYQDLLRQKLPRRLNVPDYFAALAREIVDGDTVNVIYGGMKFPVRLVGINTPEKGEPYESDSKRALFRFVWGSKVTLLCDPDNKFDKFGRLLAVVQSEGVSINLAMVRQGWAFYYPLQPHKYVPDASFAEADALARAEKRGIWGLIQKAASAAPAGKIAGAAPRTALKISSVPSHASIYLDGEFSYKQTSETIDVLPGRHHIRVSLYGYSDSEETVDVPDGTVAEVHFKLDKL